MKDLYNEIRQIELDQREKLIGQIARKGKGKPSFASAMHKIAEKESEPSNLLQFVDVAIDTHMTSDLASENLAEMFG